MSLKLSANALLTREHIFLSRICAHGSRFLFIKSYRSYISADFVHIVQSYFLDTWPSCESHEEHKSIVLICLQWHNDNDKMIKKT